METYDKFRKNNETQLKNDYVAERINEFEMYCADEYLKLCNYEQETQRNQETEPDWDTNKDEAEE